MRLVYSVVHVRDEFGKVSIDKDFTSLCCFQISKIHFNHHQLLLSATLDVACSTILPISRDQVDQTKWKPSVTRYGMLL